jgi:hypothetical protein
MHQSRGPKRALTAPGGELPIGEFKMSDLSDYEVQYYYQREICLLAEIGGLIQRFGSEDKLRALEQTMISEAIVKASAAS